MQCIEAKAIIVDRTIREMGEEISQFLIRIGRLLQDIEIPQQTAGIDNLWDAKDGAIQRVVMTPCGGQEVFFGE